MEKIIIVESPSKSKTIAGYLGSGYKVLSSKGHICDLATSGKDGLGIDIPNNFTPTYKVMKEKESLVNTLKRECKGHEVLLATDPDREGEAIAYHLAKTLNLDLNSSNRIQFHEITKDSVNEALKNPTPINLKMVDSQECRRMIDRILGFKISKLLQRKIGSKSAGRVQSVALLLIVNLEAEIKAFIPEAYYEMEAVFPSYKLKLFSINDAEINSKNRITDRSVLENLKNRLLSFTVSDIQSKQVKRNSSPAYTTSTLQQDASNKLGFTPVKTMKLAQGLYEGKNIGSETIGLITYMRTDSTRLADSFVKACNKHILETYGSKYIGSVKTKVQKNAQDAHEAIRPTSILRTPSSLMKYLTADEYKLYELIYNRCLASLMSAAVFNTTKVIFKNTDSLWQTAGQNLVFDGYLMVYGKSEEDMNTLLPNFNLGDSFNPLEVNILDKMTEPKKRYTEATLIKDMEDLGIGRPSTYAQTIQTLKEREYVVLDKKSIVPTEQGILTTEKLKEYFTSIINVEYTANMEADLDKIANGNKDKLEELNEFYDGFLPIFNNALENMEAKYPIPTEEICPTCGAPLVIRLGKYGEFTACSNYPDCKYIKKEESDVVETNICCPSCHLGSLVGRVATRGVNKGKLFYSCSNYPKCKNIYNDKPLDEYCPNCNSIMLINSEGVKYCSNHCNEEKLIELKCPKCGKGSIVEKKATRGANKGNSFYACSNYPKCKNLYDNEPTGEYCPNCHDLMLKDKDGNIYCASHCENKSNAQENTNLVICPKCGVGHLVERKATRGANKGNSFYGCSNYPKCKNIVSSEDYNNLIK